MNTLEKALDYLDTEHKDFRAFVSRQTSAPSIPSRDDEKRLIEMSRKATLDRGMGVVMFVQSLGVSYDDIKGPYEEFKEVINKLADYAKGVIR
jgi:hypothetical protein